jgi:hypothetical protein
LSKRQYSATAILLKKNEGSFNDKIVNPLHEWSWAFPLLACIHLAGIACGVGTAALVNLRLLGVALTQQSAARLWRDALPWTLSGLFVAISSGLLLASIDPDLYLGNAVFRLKMVFLLAAVIFYFTLVRKAAASNSANPIFAWTSLGLWAVVPVCGVSIGFAGFATGPILLSLHLVAVIALGGMVLITNLRLLGFGAQSYKATEIINGLRVPKRIAFVVAAVGGLDLFASMPESYLRNPWFWIKIGLIVLLAANSLLLQHKVKLAAGVSLVLWTGVLISARGPTTVKDIMHSMVEPSGDVLFQSVQTIADDRGVREKAPRTEAEWEGVRQRLTILTDAADLLMAANRIAARPRDRSKNPQIENEPEEIQRTMDAERSDFNRRALLLRRSAEVAMQAVDAKNKDALRLALDGIDKACESCHLHYWYPKDTRAREAAKENGVSD